MSTIPALNRGRPLPHEYLAECHRVRSNNQRRKRARAQLLGSIGGAGLEHPDRFRHQVGDAHFGELDPYGSAVRRATFSMFSIRARRCCPPLRMRGMLSRCRSVSGPKMPSRRSDE